MKKRRRKQNGNHRNNTLLQGHFSGQYRSGTGLVLARTDSGCPVEKTKKMGITEEDTTTRTLPRPVLIWYWPGIGSYKLWTPCGKKEKTRQWESQKKTTTRTLPRPVLICYWHGTIQGIVLACTNSGCPVD